MILLDSIFPERRNNEKIFHDERLVMLCDGVFAIAITLLVIDIKLPSGLQTEQAFNVALHGLMFASITYLITFIVIAGFWREHHRLMRDVKCIDARFISLTFVFLLFVAFFPVTSGIIRESDYTLAIVIYTLGFAACGFSLWFLWLYASWQRRLIDPAMPASRVVARSLHLALAPTYFSLSLLLLFVLPAGSGSNMFWSWLFLPLLSAAARWVSKRVSRSKQPQDAELAHPGPESGRATADSARVQYQETDAHEGS